MGAFADYLAQKMDVSVPKEEHPSAIIAEAMTEARELGHSVASMFQHNERRNQLEEIDIQFRGS